MSKALLSDIALRLAVGVAALWLYDTFIKGRVA
jgi:hypothetical protein